MKKIVLLLILVTTVLISVRAQELVNIRKATTPDNAIEVSTMKKFGPTTAPVQYGDNPNNVFAKNQHPVWYKFKTEKTGVLLFDIIPLDTLDNYDFVLYKYEGTNFAQDFKDNKVQPIRSNFDRVDLVKQGRTGISVAGDKKSYEKGLEVKSNENYYLLINNLYENGQGHVIVFKYLESFEIKGKVTDSENGSGIGGAQIIWENTRNKEEIYQAVTDRKGEYTLKISVGVEAHSFPRYSITAYADNYFLTDTLVPTKEIPKIDQTQLVFKMKKMKTGYNYETLGNIYFEPNEFVAVPEADKILKKLIKMMNINKNIQVRLEGHTNGFYPSTEVDLTLSENRAKTIKNYLVENGIDPARFTVEGFGCTKLIYPAAKDEFEEGFNRRVEIFITKF